MILIARAVFTMMFWVVIARWTYAEVARVSPQVASSMYQIIELASIPTHDQWDLSRVKEFGEKIASTLKTEEAFAGEQ